MRDIDKALLDIATIRDQFAAGTEFKGYGPMVIAITGLLALLVMGLQLLWPQIFASSEAALLTVWIAAAFVSIALIGIEMFMRSRRHHKGLANTMLINAVENFLPSGFAGIAVGAVVYYFSAENLWLLPGLWQIFIALGIFSALKTLPRSIAIAGMWYFLAGFVTLMIAAQTMILTPWMMGAPFAVGQLLMAALLYVASGREHG